MVDNKEQLIKTFDKKVLPNCEVKKEELEGLREQMKDASEEKMRYAELEYNVRKQINIINREADLHAELDKAIGFLDKLIKQ